MSRAVRSLRSSWVRFGALAAILAIGLLPALPLAHEVLSHRGADESTMDHVCAEHADHGVQNPRGEDRREKRGLPPSAPRKCPVCSDLILAKLTPPIVGAPALIVDRAGERVFAVECEVPARGESRTSAQPRGPPRAG